MLLLWAAHLLPAATSNTGHFQTPILVAVLGIIQGMTYGLLAIGLVLIYRSNRIINFAHGQIGVFAAAFFALASAQWHVPYWVALPMALAIGAAVGAVAETAVIRRMRNAPRLMSVVATLGVGQFLGLLAFAVNDTTGAGGLFPQPPGMPTFTVGSLVVTPAYSGMLILSPLVAVGLAVFSPAQPLRVGDPQRISQPGGGPDGWHLRRSDVAVLGAGRRPVCANGHSHPANPELLWGGVLRP